MVGMLPQSKATVLKVTLSEGALEDSLKETGVPEKNGIFRRNIQGI